MPMNRDAATVDSPAEACGAMAEPAPLEFAGGGHAVADVASAAGGPGNARDQDIGCP